MGSFLKWAASLTGKKKFAFDQTFHALWGALMAIPLALVGAPLWVCTLAPVINALPREFIDQWPVNDWSDTRTDLAFFGVGGAVGFFLIFFLT